MEYDNRDSNLRLRQNSPFDVVSAATEADWCRFESYQRGEGSTCGDLDIVESGAASDAVGSARVV